MYVLIGIISFIILVIIFVLLMGVLVAIFLVLEFIVRDVLGLTNDNLRIIGIIVCTVVIVGYFSYYVGMIVYEIFLEDYIESRKN